MKREYMLHGFAVASTVMFLLLQFYDPAILREHLEAKTFDLRMFVKNRVLKPTPPEDILIVTVDEKSILEMGRWPWSRAVMGGLIEKISSGAPRVIGIDIMFCEREAEEADMRLAGALEGAGNAVLAAGFIVEGEEREKPELDYLWDHAFMSVKSTKAIDWKQWIVKPQSVLAPIEELAMASTVGSVYTQPDRDGVLRWEILYVYYEEDFYASMPLHVARIYSGVKMEDMSLEAGLGVMLGNKLIPADLSGRVLINYIGREGTFNYISATNVINGRVDPSMFRDKVVMLGTSAVATFDQKVTPLSANMPGIEKNATVVANIIDDAFIKKSPGIIEMVVTLLTAALLSILLHRMRAFQGTALALSLIALYILFSFHFFIYELTWVNVIYPVFNMFSIYSVQTTTKFFLEERKAKQIRRMFSSYVSPAVVEALISNPEMAGLGGQKKEVTVLFSDIAGFTSLSEKLEPEEVVALLNEYFTEMTNVIFRWEGTFDKIVGDEIMAFWGAPMEQPNHAELAARCSLHMFTTLRKLQEKWRAEGRPVLDCGIGLNSGVVLVGNIGALDKKMDYTIIGDHVNAGARVEALTRQYNAKILVTEHTARYIQELIDAKKMWHVELIFRDSVKVKGKERPLGIYEFRETEEGARRRST
jgi:adenylate cyclase